MTAGQQESANGFLSRMEISEIIRMRRSTSTMYPLLTAYGHFPASRTTVVAGASTKMRYLEQYL